MAVGQRVSVGRVAPSGADEFLRTWETDGGAEVEQTVQAPIDGLVESFNDTVSATIETTILPANTGGFRRWIKNVGNVTIHINFGAVATTAHWPIEPDDGFDCSFTTKAIHAIPASGTMSVARLEFEAAP